MSNFTHTAQEILNRCFNDEANGLRVGGPPSVAAGHNVTFSEQDIWNRVFEPEPGSNNVDRLRLNG